MEASFIDVIAWSYGVAAVVYFLFSLYLGIGWKGGAHGGRLLLVVILSSLWTSCVLAYTLTHRTEWLGSVIILDYLRTFAWFGFLLGLIDVVSEHIIPKRTIWRFSLPQSITILLALMTVLSLTIQNSAAPRSSLIAPLVLSIWMLALIEQLYRNFPAGSRWGIKPLCLGVGGAYAFDLYTYADAFLFGQVDSELAAVRGVIHALAVPLVGLSAVRSRAWTFRISMSRQLVFHSTTIMVAALYLLLISVAGYFLRWFGGSWGRALQITFSFVGLVAFFAIIFSGVFRARLKVFLNKHFFVLRYDYRQEWLKFNQALATPTSERTLEQSVIVALADLVESPSGTLFMRDQQQMYAPRAQINQVAIKAVESSTGSLCQFLQTSQWILNLEEYRTYPVRYGNLSLPSWLANMPDAWLVVPLIANANLIGFVVLARPRAMEEVNWEVRDLLKTAASQAASYLLQMQASEALLEAQKFDSFNRMSAFVVHDLKNLVAQMSLMLKNAVKHKDNPEFQADMLMTTEHVTERMRQLMVQLQEKKSIDQQKPVLLDVLAQTLLAHKKHLNIQIDTSIEPGLAVFAHADKLERVIGHILQNALDATPDYGKVALRVSAQEDRVVIVVADSGCGMTAEFIHERLFKPFQSTKQNGMGIGCYEVQQYVQELGGQVEVQSELERGTQFTINLPRVK